MRKNIFGKQLSRDANERKALFKTLASSFVISERIETTEAKAKAIKPYVEKLVTKARKRGLDARQFIQPFLSKEATEKMVTDMSVRFAKREGGYTRIIRLGHRFSDNAPLVMMEWVEKKPNLPASGQGIKNQKSKSNNVTEKAASKTAKKAKMPSRKQEEIA